jgi:RNA polymerase sigma factor (sigma-70 family)
LKPINEAELVQMCLANNREGQHYLYNKYCDAMYNICCRMISNSYQAEEVLQDAFLTVFNKIEKYTFESTLGAWIKRIVINKCIDHLRQRKMQFSELTDNEREVAETDEEGLDINVKILHKAIEALPDGYRTVFSLYAIEGYDHEEIAHILKISEQTSKSQYHRAKEKLKQMIKEGGDINKLYN